MIKLEGGTRLNGDANPIDSGFPKVSVVTVAYNGGKELEETILSVLNQTFKNAEYIIIDGGSTDNTLEILQKYDSKIDYWVSEKDSGIYDAMNKGIALARGSYLNFLNCGDKFYNENVLATVFETFRHKSEMPIIYGDREVRYSSGKTLLSKAGEVADLWKGSQFCHQSVFIPTAYHQTHPYNPAIPIAADFDFFFRAYSNGIQFKKMDLILSSIEAGGISDTHRVEVIKSWWQVVGKGFKTNLYYRIRIAREVIVKRVKTIIKW
jgi:glycosyltransferase involved in cell wall biosynthesis